MIDANNPAEVLDSFQVCSSHLLCIASVPGDYKSSSKPWISCCLLVLGALTFESIVPVSAHFHNFNEELNAVIV